MTDFSAWLAFPLAWALLLIVSGVAKARDVEGTVLVLRGLGLPQSARPRFLAIALPVVELILAAGLLFTRGTLFVVVAAALTLLAIGYLVVIILILRQGTGARCACFGSLSGGEVTKVTALRNILLLMGAIAVLFGASQGWSVWNALSRFGLPDWAWLVAVAWLLALTLTIGVRQVVQPSYEREPIPDATLIGPDGPMTLADMARTQARVLLFLSQGCQPCTEIAALVPQWSPKLWPIAIHAVLHDESAAPSFANIAPVILYADHEDTAAQAFQIRGTPAAVILGVDGLVAGGPVVGGEAVVQLIDDVLAEKGALTS